MFTAHSIVMNTSSCQVQLPQLYCVYNIIIIIAGLSEKKKSTSADFSILQARFQKLLLDVCRRLKTIPINEEIRDNIHFFLVSLPSGYADFIPPSPDLSEIVQALSENEMLDFWNCYLLTYFIDIFKKWDLQLASMMKQYLGDRFDSLETGIQHFTLAAKKSFVPESHHPFVKQNHVQLSMKVDECMAKVSLLYIDALHEELASRLRLPLYAIFFHTVIKESMHLVWYIPVTALDRAKEALRNIHLYSREIVSVVIDNKCIYWKGSGFQRVLVSHEELVRICIRFWRGNDMHETCI